ncbi:MAG: peptide-binding protein, partial [Planctomycetota bacterium]|nr:peptide-binding protein [Planctomycetota bacterium]
IIEQDMIKAGIRVDIKPIEWSVYTQVLEKRDYDVCSLAWTGGVEGDPYQIWHGSGANREGSSNHVAYASEEADRLIEEGRRTLDKEARYAIYHRLHEVIARDQPYTFLVAGTAVMAQAKRFRNVIVYKSGQMNSLLQWAGGD